MCFQKKWSEQENERFENRFTKILSNLFTKTQIDMLLNPKKKVYKWQPQDISSAITLRKKYIPNLKHKDTYMVTLEKYWTRMIKVTVVSFYETYVSRRICFDKMYEQMVGPYKCVQTVVVRRLVASWKQPVYYSYDTPMTKQILTNIICNLYEIMYNVVAIVRDTGPSNVGLRRDLGISMDKTYFEHPVNIYVFADVPHLLKLTRNHFLDKGFVLPNEGANRMNVKLAAHIFSNSVAKSISYLGNKNKISNHNWKEASEVIQLFNDWFDLLNTQKKCSRLWII
ncbi:general transcription factor II-I repeat domain-containing protein 2-like [Aphis craccivora]|uniref:General transcription factor II-I repeat domain-containing protein 2-like n=1 Tax=Aphis craccivora TaxID=307492 RepID=A0A6G0XW44_APHCR|nr:general transcription factor II-I repeat domain-containing protein 2-like [Aphis craccivora]